MQSDCPHYSLTRNDDTIQNADQHTTPSADHSPNAPLIDAEDLIGRTFLLDKQEDGQKLDSLSQRFHGTNIKLYYSGNNNI
jgi:hypothetical protein